jgi:hypothetical protein
VNRRRRAEAAARFAAAHAELCAAAGGALAAFDFSEFWWSATIDVCEGARGRPRRCLLLYGCETREGLRHDAAARRTSMEVPTRCRSLRARVLFARTCCTMTYRGSVWVFDRRKFVPLTVADAVAVADTDPDGATEQKTEEDPHHGR